MNHYITYLVAIIGFVLPLSGCTDPSNQSDYQIYFEGRDYDCDIDENGYEYYHILECYSKDSFKLVASFAGNIFHGPIRSYYPNGSLHIEAKNVDDKLEGEFIEYTEDKELKTYTYVVKDIEFYSKSIDTLKKEFIGKLPVEMEVKRLVDSTELYFSLLYSNLKVFYTGCVFNYDLDEERRIEFTTTSETNKVRLKLPRTFVGEVDVEFLELDTGYMFQAFEQMSVIVDSSHSGIKLIGNVTSDEENLKILKEHLLKVKPSLMN